MTDLLNLYHSISGYGLPFALFVALIALERGWVVFKREADALRARITELETQNRYIIAEKDEWRDVALSGQLVARKAVGAAKLAVGR